MLGSGLLCPHFRGEVTEGAGWTLELPQGRGRCGGGCLGWGQQWGGVLEVTAPHHHLPRVAFLRTPGNTSG